MGETIGVVVVDVKSASCAYWHLSCSKPTHRTIRGCEVRSVGKRRRGCLLFAFPVVILLSSAPPASADPVVLVNTFGPSPGYSTIGYGLSIHRATDHSPGLTRSRRRIAPPEAPPKHGDSESSQQHRRWLRHGRRILEREFDAGHLPIRAEAAERSNEKHSTCAASAERRRGYRFDAIRRTKHAKHQGAERTAEKT
jgi:hypothetical protein